VKPVWFAIAAALAAFLVRRRHRLEPTLEVGGALAVVAMVVYGTGVVHLPNLEKLLVDVGARLGNWTYLLVGAMAFLETGAFVGLVAPGETAMLLGGLVAGQGHIDLLTLIAIVWTAAVAGDLTSFALGRRLGRTFLVKHGPKVQITEERLQTVEGFFDRHGGKAILIGRFVGLVRAIAPFLAGSSGMALKRFLPYDVIGAGLWTSTFVVLGYVFWQSFNQLVKYAKTGALALATVIVLVVAIVWAVRWLRQPANRDRARDWLERQGERPLLRPLVRVLAPVVRWFRGPARFLWQRLTPGELGLELTTLLAVVSVGAFTFVSNTIRVVRHPLQVGDRNALDLADRLHQPAVVDVVKVVTQLGSLPGAAAVVVLTAALLLWRREVVPALALAVGLGLTVAGVHIAKAAVDRPRPPHPLVHASLSSFPSGHAAYAVAWIAAAVVLSRLLPSLASRFAFVTVGVVLAAVVGLSRVYLRAHYLSDVAAGWALGATVLAACGMVAVIVRHLRHNAPARP
jgi:undecaprenyl-diphosphatase